MRVVSLLPAATEIVAAIGGAGLLVGVSHECDFPAQINVLPRVTSSRLDSRLTSREIDAEMALAQRSGRATVDVDVATLARLRPDVLIGQSLCDVCAVAEPELERVVTSLQPTPWLVTLHPHMLTDVFVDIWRVGEALGLPDEAEEVVAGLRYRLRRLKASVPATRPRVLVLEWIDPPYVAGHWVPELVALAGGEDVGNAPGMPSEARSWRQLAALAPDLVVVALCGFAVPRAREEVTRVVDEDALRLLQRRVEFLDGNAYTSRPGPRLVDAAEQLARVIPRRSG